MLATALQEQTPGVEGKERNLLRQRLLRIFVTGAERRDIG